MPKKESDDMVARLGKVELLCTEVALMRQDIDYVKKDMDLIKKELGEIKVKLDSNYVSKTEFEPVKRIVYGLVALVLTAFFAALIGMVISK